MSERDGRPITAVGRAIAAERRSARLLLARELASGRIGEDDLGGRDLLVACTTHAVPSALTRRLAARRVAAGTLRADDESARPLAAARAAVLGAADAAGPPRALIVGGRLAADTDLGAFDRDQALLRARSVPRLVAVAGDVRGAQAEAAEALRGDPLVWFGLLADGRGERVPATAVRQRRGSLRERMRRALQDPRADAIATRAEFDRVALQEGLALYPRVAVARDGLLDRPGYDGLARAHDIVVAGAPSVAELGWHRSPLFRGAAVLAQATDPFDGAADAAAALDALRDERAAVDVVVDLGAGPLDPAALDRLAPHAAPWEPFLDAIAASR